MKRRSFVRLTSALSGTAAFAAPKTVFALDRVRSTLARVRRDRAWLHGTPGGCAGADGGGFPYALAELLGTAKRTLP